MSGGPPHHPHGRQAPSPNTAWNHLQMELAGHGSDLNSWPRLLGKHCKNTQGPYQKSSGAGSEKVPNFYPRQPQHAHMSNEHPLLPQPTWHTPTTEPVKSVPHSHLFNLEQMISERPFARHSPGVDLTLQRNGSQNGELPPAPISLSVRDANKINSLPAGAIDIQAVELTKLKPTGSPVLKPTLPTSPGIRSPISPVLLEKQESPKSLKRPAKRMDSIIERLNPTADKSEKLDKLTNTEKPVEKEKPPPEQAPERERPCQSSVIVQPSTIMGSHDENSSSSSVAKAPTPTNVRDEDVISPFSNEDSTDSSKSRRKRKPAKTIRVPKDPETSIDVNNQIVIIDDSPKPSETVTNQAEDSEALIESQAERRRSGSAPPGSPTPPPPTRRKTSSESETIANIAAMVEKTALIKPEEENNCIVNSSLGSDTNNSVATVLPEASENSSKPISVSVIKTKENIIARSEADVKDEVKSIPETSTPVIVPASSQKKVTDSNSFVEVENKLEEMFAGIADTPEPVKIEKMSLDYTDYSKSLGLEESKTEDNLVKLDQSAPSTSQCNDSVTSTSNELSSANQSFQKRSKRKATKSRRFSESISLEATPKRKKGNKKSKSVSESSTGKSKATSKKNKGKNFPGGKQVFGKVDLIKDIYAYDSGSNASSSKSRGPFVQIRGSRESPISVSIVNTPTNEDDSDKKSSKSKKYHDDTEYRHKVRSRGLHCSTLSNKYDAQTRDATWICVFCKRGPHATDPNLSGPSRFNASAAAPPPGDLFGPYIITTDSPEFQRRLDDPYDQQFRSKKVARAVSATANNRPATKKSKRKHSDSYDSRSSVEGADSADIYLGITETKDKVYEVWAHEDCIVWSPGVYLVGPKIVGLEEAVWTSCNVACSRCRYRGANLCCVKRGCMNVMHFGCAAVSDWYLDEENYRALCVAHKIP